MILGQHWPIPHDELLDGSIITLKNADELARDSEILLSQGRISRALSIATLSLEEFGKHCMLQEALETKKKLLLRSGKMSLGITNKN